LSMFCQSFLGTPLVRAQGVFVVQGGEFGHGLVVLQAKRPCSGFSASSMVYPRSATRASMSRSSSSLHSEAMKPSWMRENICTLKPLPETSTLPPTSISPGS